MCQISYSFQILNEQLFEIRNLELVAEDDEEGKGRDHTLMMLTNVSVNIMISSVGCVYRSDFSKEERGKEGERERERGR